MAADPVQLLRSLSGVAPARPSLDVAAGRDAVAGPAFADLLAKAKSGTLASDRPVTIDPISDLTLSDEQSARLAAAADRLEAAGVRNALVVLDGKKLILDVHQRQVTPAQDANLIDGIDGVLDLSTSPAASPIGLFGPLVRADAASSPAARGARSPSSVPIAPSENPAIARLLAERAQS